MCENLPFCKFYNQSRVTWDWWLGHLARSPGTGKRGDYLTNGRSSGGNTQGLPSWMKKTPTSLEYPLSVLNKNTTLKPFCYQNGRKGSSCGQIRAWYSMSLRWGFFQQRRKGGEKFPGLFPFVDPAQTRTKVARFYENWLSIVTVARFRKRPPPTQFQAFASRALPLFQVNLPERCVRVKTTGFHDSDCVWERERYTKLALPLPPYRLDWRSVK